MKNFGYSKDVKLKQKKEIDLLFAKGKWQTCGNIRVIFSPQNYTSKLQVGVSVSKKLYKRAVDRNRIKRLLREAFRLNKLAFKDAFGADSSAMIFYIGKKMPANFKEIEIDFLKLCAKQNRN